MPVMKTISNTFSVSTVEDGQDAHEVQPNILLRTVFDRGLDIVKEAWNSNDWSHVSASSSQTVDGRKSLQIVASGDYTQVWQNVYERLEPATWYTLSFWCQSTAAWHTFLYSGSASPCIDTTAGWYIDGERRTTVPVDGDVTWAAGSQSYHTITFKTASSFPSATFNIMLRVSSGTVYVCMPKLEQGEAATAYMAHEDDLVGEQGERGKTGRMYYYGGEYDATSADTFLVSDAQCPFFYLQSTDNYYVYDKAPNGTYTMAQLGSPGNDNPWCTLMYDDFKYLITEAVFGSFAKFGSAVISGDWMISTNGTVNGAASQDYTKFDPAYPNTDHVTGGQHNFIPVYAVDLLTGAAHFSSGKVLFNADGSGQLAGGKISWNAAGDATFAGALSGVTGSFQSLEAVSSGGVPNGGKIRFGDSALMYFEGDIYHNGGKDGRSYRFYGADIWCRGVFGAAHYSTLKIQGQYGYYFVNGALNTPVQVNLTAHTDSQGRTYYPIPCYPSGMSTLASGCAITTIVFAVMSGGSETFRYLLAMEETQRITLINASKSTSVEIYTNGRLDTLRARDVEEVIQVPTSFFISGEEPTGLGAGLMLGPYRTNDNW